ncbi:MAG: SCO family protein [Roseiflexaceae bacterium]|nr:SCO family protein [Roseiflexaceae bacterium]
MFRITLPKVRILLLALTTLLALSSCGTHEFRGQLLDAPTAATDFTIIDQNGQPFQLSAQRGKLVALFFGFTHCPDVCPTTLSDMKAIRQRLGSDAEKLQVVFISIDPERDTPELVNRYAKAFDPSFIGLSAPQATLEPLYQAYGVTAIKRELPNSALGYTMDHSTYIYIIDTAGKYRMIFPFDMPIDDITSDLSYLIKNG